MAFTATCIKNRAYRYEGHTGCVRLLEAGFLEGWHPFLPMFLRYKGMELFHGMVVTDA